MYQPEYEKALLGTAGPGPSYYRYEKFNESMAGEKFKFTIPRVSGLIKLIV